MKINNISPGKHEFLQRLSTIADCPKSLYYIGSLPPPSICCIAIVGTRRPTGYGRAVTEQIAEMVASRGAVVVSGMALGIDAIAHQSALRAGGMTVAVLPSGVDKPYPASHRQLARDILLGGGALISERENGYEPHHYDFVLRNRIVSGLSDTLIVTEANLRSGTMSTVARALEQGKAVYAVPGPITSPLSAGCNRLIAQGATPITDIESLLGDLGLDSAHQERFGDTDEEAVIIRLVRLGISDGEELLARSGLSAELFSQTLTMCEIKGLLKPLGGNMWRL